MKIEEKFGDFQGWKILSDATLLGYTKKELVEIIRTLEYNWNCAEQTINQQAKNFEQMLKEIENKEKESAPTTVRVSVR